MKDKEKQIEEMAKALLEYIKVYGKLHLTVDGIDNTARLFVKFGITKLPKDSVVLTETEQLAMCIEQWGKGYAQASNDYKEMAEKLAYHNYQKIPENSDSLVVSKEDWKENHDLAFMSGKEEGSKETAEKYHKLTQEAIERVPHAPNLFKQAWKEKNNQIAKQFGVEIKE